jgi:hypothetical protein
MVHLELAVCSVRGSIVIACLGYALTGKIRLRTMALGFRWGHMLEIGGRRQESVISDWRLGARDWRLETRDWRRETRDWRLGIGDWRLETGDWRRETRDWRLGIGDWRLETGISCALMLPGALSCGNASIFSFTTSVGCELTLKVSNRCAIAHQFLNDERLSVFGISGLSSSSCLHWRESLPATGTVITPCVPLSLRGKNWTAF